MGRSVDLCRFDQSNLYKKLQMAYPDCEMHYVTNMEVLEQFFTREKIGESYFYMNNDYNDIDPMSSYCRMVEKIFKLDYVYDVAYDAIYYDKNVDYDELAEKLSFEIRIEMEKDKMKL